MTRAPPGAGAGDSASLRGRRGRFRAGFREVLGSTGRRPRERREGGRYSHRFRRTGRGLRRGGLLFSLSAPPLLSKEEAGRAGLAP